MRLVAMAQKARADAKHHLAWGIDCDRKSERSGKTCDRHCLGQTLGEGQRRPRQSDRNLRTPLCRPQSRRCSDNIRDDPMPEKSDSFLRQAMLESQSVAVFILDREHRVTFWNRACESLTGCSAAEMTGQAEVWRAFYTQPRPTMADLSSTAPSIGPPRSMPCKASRNCSKAPATGKAGSAIWAARPATSFSTRPHLRRRRPSLGGRRNPAGHHRSQEYRAPPQRTRGRSAQGPVDRAPGNWRPRSGQRHDDRVGGVLSDTRARPRYASFGKKHIPTN